GVIEVAGDGAIDEGVRGVVEQLVVGGDDKTGVVPGEAGGVVRRIGDHGEDRARAGVDGHDGALVGAERLGGGALNTVVDGELDRGSLSGLPGEDRVEPREKLVAGGSAEVVVEFALDAGAALAE